MPSPEPTLRRFLSTIATLAMLACAATLPAWAGSSASSAASEGSSASVGSSSTSVEKSSNSSAGDKKLAAGDYRIVEIAEAEARPGLLRLRLQAAAGEAAGLAEFFLWVPQQAAARGQLAAGQIVSARERVYGLEFTRAETGQAFFLVVDDAWHRELQTRPVAI
jgi:hypothetical protein